MPRHKTEVAYNWSVQTTCWGRNMWCDSNDDEIGFSNFRLPVSPLSPTNVTWTLRFVWAVDSTPV